MIGAGKLLKSHPIGIEKRLQNISLVIGVFERKPYPDQGQVMEHEQLQQADSGDEKDRPVALRPGMFFRFGLFAEGLFHRGLRRPRFV